MPILLSLLRLSAPGLKFVRKSQTPNIQMIHHPRFPWHALPRCLTKTLLPWLALTSAAAQTTTRNNAADAPAKKETDEVVLQLSPFEVKGETNGYYASNTLSGTRLNSKLEDLGASITVVTKQQMEDFSLQNINDIFLYEANTEGTGNYTNFTVDRAGVVVDNTTGGLAQDNATTGAVGSNRIRGIGQANIAKGNFATSGRVPIDPITIDSVEISRGPNSSIFGLGNASGTVNMIPTRANLQKRRTKVELQADSYGGNRVALDHNQPLLPGVLALRGTAVFQEEGFERQPSVSRTKRYNGMLTYKPFKSTTLRASFEHYENFARLPNSIMPSDGISYWRDNGSPTWDPVTWTVHRNGTSTVVPFNSNQATESNLLGAGLSSGGSNVYTRPNIFINPDGSVGVYMPGRLGNASTPQSFTSNARFVQTGTPPQIPLGTLYRSVTDRAIYDWSSINLLSANLTQNKDDNATIELEQFFLNTPRQLLAFQGGWYHEKADRYRRDFLGNSGVSPMVVYIDVNERLLDGTANPYFLRPYLEAREPINYRQPFERDIFRGQLAYQLKLSEEKGWLHWLGDNSFSGYVENSRTFTANYRYKDAVISNHSWLAAGADRANGATVGKGYYRFYVGDAQGNNVDYGSGSLNGPLGAQTFRWFNGATGQWVNESVTVGEALWAVPNQNNRRTDALIKTAGGTWQGHLLQDRIVVTLGVRKDQSYNRTGPTNLAADGYSRVTNNDDEWPSDWIESEGRTTTNGIVVKPLRGMRALERMAQAGGAKGRVAEVLSSVNLHYNESDSFLPDVLAQSLFTELLPNPTGKGKDYGISINLGSKFVLRYNQYETNQINSRSSENGIIASRVARVEVNYNGNNDPLNLYGLATTWVNTANPGISADQREIAIARVMGMPLGQVQRLGAYTISDTSNVVAKGKEIEINYNPTSFWTMKMAIAQQKAIDDGISDNLVNYLAARLPVWKSIIDPIRGTPWYTTDYGGSRPTPEIFLTQQVYEPIKLAQANEGKPRSQVREWRVNALSTYRLAGVTDHRWLKNVSLSGAIRWEDKASIGYYAQANDPTSYDPNRPIYDKARAYFDFGVGYTTRVFADKIRLRVQLNARNLFENGRLQPVGALPDGTPHTYRIIDPRLIMLTAAFEF